MPTSTSSIKLTGTTSTTKPTGTPAQKDLEHKAEALLIADVIKKLAVWHEQQLLKGSASKIPAEALKSIRQLNEMLDEFTIEEETTVKPVPWRPVDHCLRKKTSPVSSQKQRELSKVVGREPYSSPASNVDLCCAALQSFEVSSRKTEILLVSSTEDRPDPFKRERCSLPFLATTKKACNSPAPASVSAPAPQTKEVDIEMSGHEDSAETSLFPIAEVGKPDTEMAEAETRDDDDMTKPDTEMLEAKTCEVDNVVEPDIDMSETKTSKDNNVQSPPEMANVNRPEAAVDPLPAKESMMGDAEDHQKPSKDVGDMVLEPANGATAPSAAPISVPANAVSPNMGFTDDEQQIFERLKQASLHQSKGIACYTEMMELPWSDGKKMKRVIAYMVKSLGKGSINTARDKIENLYNKNSQPNAGTVDRVLFAGALSLRRKDAKPKPLPAPYTCAYETIRSTAATQRSVAMVALRRNMGARKEPVSREETVRKMFLHVSNTMQEDFLKGKISTVISWDELQDLVVRVEYGFHASKLGTTKDRFQRTYVKFVEGFLTDITNKLKRYIESKDPVNPLPQPHNSAALKHHAPSVIASVAQRLRVN
ncbi:hypothetical protein G6514_007476 [Epicoccum nigrum]|nr:hypothetical protein G6514_007476 [Epicoccum nigrum]